MNRMNLQVEKQALIKALEQTNDEALIKAIQQMVEYAVQRDEEYLGVTAEQYNKELDEANARIERGDFVNHEEAIKQIEAWRTKDK
jgi:predicted transcriptional regulator